MKADRDQGSLLPLSVEAGCVQRGGRTILGPVDLTVERAGTIAVMGPNGAGKTTLLRAVHGLVRLSSGRIRWSAPLHEVRSRQAFVFQTPIVLRRTVVDNVAYPLRLQGVGRREARATAGDFATRVGLGDLLDNPAATLSGGEKQKLALARALICEPELLILDEPTANLDGASTRDIETILTTCAARGVCVLIATHNMGQARRLADDVVFLHHGTVRERQRTEAFFSAPMTHEACAFLRGDILE